jgi:hypothetical protein
MVQKIILLLFIVFTCRIKSQVVNGSGGNKYIYVDPKLIRGDISFSKANLNFPDIRPRDALLLHTKCGARIISAFMTKKNKFAIRDEFFCDLSLGKLTSEPLKYFNNAESKFSTVFQFGYEFMAGYRNEKFALMGGLKFQWSNAFIGRSEFSGNKLLPGTYPLMIRGEYAIGNGEEFRLVCMAWSNFNSEKNSSGANIDIPISKKRRLWFTVQYQYMTCSGSAPANFDNNNYTTGFFNQWFAGIKVGSIY